MSNRYNHITRALLLLLTTFCLLSCNKEWLEVKPDKTLVVPSRIEHFQALLDNDYGVFNNDDLFLGEASADSYYLLLDYWQSLSYIRDQANAYVWNKEIYENQPSANWKNAYEKVYYTNLVLEGIAKIARPDNDPAPWNNVKGSALFFRAQTFHELAQLFCLPYSKATAEKDSGIPLRMTSDLTVRSVRATVQQTYDRIIADLTEALTLLPNDPAYKTRPSKTAALALLSRVYLSMEQYDLALKYSKDALAIHGNLMNYNTTPAAISTSFKEYNEEVLFHSRMGISIIGTGSTDVLIDKSLYQSYADNDLRKSMYYTTDADNVFFMSDYAGDAYPGAGSGAFSGLATDELYLTKAECEARASQTTDAVQTINHLLETRWKTGTFVPFTASNADDALRFILQERRKSLIFRGLRWSDLRRLNKDPRFAITLKRTFENGDTYTLPPGDARYVLPIPVDEIAASGIEQNPR